MSPKADACRQFPTTEGQLRKVSTSRAILRSGDSRGLWERNAKILQRPQVPTEVIYPLDHCDAYIRSRDGSGFLPAANNGQESETDSVDNDLALLSACQIKSASNNPGAVPFESGDCTQDPQSPVSFCRWWSRRPVQCCNARDVIKCRKTCQRACSRGQVQVQTICRCSLEVNMDQRQSVSFSTHAVN